MLDIKKESSNIELQCPDCRKELSLSLDTLICPGGHCFYVKEGILDLTPKGYSLPDIYKDPDYQAWSRISSRLLLESYDKNPWLRKIQDKGHCLIEAMAETAEGWVLDLGCGFGRHFDFLKNRQKAIGFDANLESLKKALKNNPESIFIKGQMEKLPFQNNFFSIIYAVYSLEHLPNLALALAEVKRVLAGGGQMLVALPAEGGLLYDGLRKLTTAPYFTKKYGIDYAKVVKIEHCNTAKKVIALLSSEFALKKIKCLPFNFRSLNISLIVAAVFQKQ